MQIIKEYVAEKKEKLKQLDLSNLKLVIIQVGAVEASCRYVRNKLKDCESVNLPAELIKLPEEATEAQILDLIKSLNEDKTVTGFIVQLPLPKHISEQKVIEAIDPKKDVDGFSKLAKVNPGTPQGILDYLVDNNVEFQDKNAVVIGRSNIVGRPMAKLLLEKNCNVTILHSRTSEENKRLYLKNADIIVSAVGKRNIITPDYELKPTAIVIDVGINQNDEGKLCGDIEQDLPVAFKSPVPAGVGLLTRVAVIENLISLSKN